MPFDLLRLAQGSEFGQRQRLNGEVQIRFEIVVIRNRLYGPPAELEYVRPVLVENRVRRIRFAEAISFWIVKKQLNQLLAARL